MLQNGVRTVCDHMRYPNIPVANPRKVIVAGMWPGLYCCLKLLTTIALASQNEHLCNTLMTVTDNSMTIACSCTTVPVKSMMVSGNHTVVAGYGTTITGDPYDKTYTLLAKISSRPLANVMTADANWKTIYKFALLITLVRCLNLNRSHMVAVGFWPEIKASISQVPNITILM